MAARTDDYVRGMADEMIAELTTSTQPNHHHGLAHRYLKGEHDLPYVPAYARAEYIATAKKSITNWLPRVTGTFTKALTVIGYRASDANQNAPAWAYWQANGLDARQTIAHRGALAYGASYVLVLPGSPAPLIRPLPAMRSMAFYEDEDDDFPVRAILRVGTSDDNKELWRAFEGGTVWTLVRDNQSKLEVREVEEHPLGVTPWVRFRSQLDDEPQGLVIPFIPVQDRINESVFTLQVAIQFGSFRQRWAKGLTVNINTSEFLDEEGQVPNPDFGKPIESFDVAADRLWVTDNPDAEFGEFQQTDTNKHLAAYESAVQTLAALADVPPNVLRGDIQNVSADALASMYDSTERQIQEFRTLFGESWEQTLRLAAQADGNKVTADDIKAQARWRQTHVRSLAATVDALVKMAQGANLPDEAVWEMFPDATDEDIVRWRNMLAAQQEREDARADEQMRRQQAAADRPQDRPEAPAAE